MGDCVSFLDGCQQFLTSGFVTSLLFEPFITHEEQLTHMGSFSSKLRNSILFLLSLNFLFSIIYLFHIQSPFLCNVIGLSILITDILSMGSLLYYMKKLLDQKIVHSKVQKFNRNSVRILFGLNFHYFLVFMVNFVGYSDVRIINFFLGSLIFGSLWVMYAAIVYQIIQGNKLLELNAEIDKISAEDQDEIQIPEYSSKRDLLKFIFLSIFCIAGIVWGIIVDLSLLISGSVIPGFFGTGIVAGMLGIFFGLGGLSITITLLFVLLRMPWISQLRKFLQRMGKKNQTRTLISIAIIGFIISSLSFLPLASTPIFIQTAGKEFDRAFNPEFGGDWRNSIDSIVEDTYFSPSPFELAEYFLGPANPQCRTFSDILYFNGSLSNYSQDSAIELYFDAFLPPENVPGLPGQNSTLIRIHGVGWTIGDKGNQNMNMMNRYFAAQGYCVFDIQYGLNNVSDLFSNLPGEPEYVKGNFTIDDMMRHIGNFTKYLERNAAEYGANLDSVFVSGGSAGGQLACATALSLHHNNYSVFSSAFTIKGLIPFYPANNPQFEFSRTSRPEWVNPDLLVDNSSPPCLIFQGDKDALYPAAIRFKEAYLSAGKSDCGLLVFPFAGHAADIYFPGYYNQVFLYYMERFMYLYH